MCITSYEYGQKRILEKMERIMSGLYTTTICLIKSHYVALPQGPRTKLHFSMIVWDTLDDLQYAVSSNHHTSIH